MNKPPLLYFCSNGLGENLQASPAMRALKREYYVIMLCRQPIHLIIHPDCFDELIPYRNDTPDKTLNHIVARLAAANSSRTTDLVPTPWTAHLDPQTEICDALVGRGLIHEHRERKGTGYPCSASRHFYFKTMGMFDQILHSTAMEMSAAEPDLKREGDYDILVSIGSAEKCRRLPEAQQVMLVNQLMNAGFRVCLHTAASRPDKLHPRAGVAVNRWNQGTMEQLKELVWSCRLVIGPDSGTNHLALAYGKKLIFLESREQFAAVVDPVYYGGRRCVNVTHPAPSCLQNCSARRQPSDDWPKPPNRAAMPGYPHNMECFSLPEVPCLQFNPGHIAGIVVTAQEMLK